MVGPTGAREGNSDRKFVLIFYLEDDTLAIREPPVRNSGHVGGNFLCRGRVKRPREQGDSYYVARDFCVGSEITVNAQCFRVKEADEHTLRYMEHHSKDFPESNVEFVLQKLREKKELVSRTVLKYDIGGGALEVSQLQECFDEGGVTITTQELLTLKRKLDRKKKGRFQLSKLLKLLEPPQPGLMGL